MDSGDEHKPDVVLKEVTRDVASGAVGNDAILRAIPSEEELCFDCHSWNDQQGLQARSVCSDSQEKCSALLLTRNRVEGMTGVTGHHDRGVLQVDKALETALVEIENQPTGDALNGLSEEAKIGINVPSADLESVVLHRAAAGDPEVAACVQPAT